MVQTKYRIEPKVYFFRQCWSLLLAFGRSEPVNIELLEPSAESQPGETVFVDGFSANENPEVLNPKKKIWDKLQVRNL